MERTFSAEASGCRLTVELESVDAEHMKLRYNFANHSARNAYFFEEIEGEYRDDHTVAAIVAHPVYVVIEETGVVLAKRVPAIPPGSSKPEQPTGPFATRVAPGGSESRAVDLTLPLGYYNPHLSIDEDVKGSSSVAKLLGRDGVDQVARMDAWFELGFVLLLPAGDAVMDKYDRCESGDGRVWYDWHLAHPERQTLLRVGPLSQVPVQSFAAGR